MSDQCLLLELLLLSWLLIVVAKHCSGQAADGLGVDLCPECSFKDEPSSSSSIRSRAAAAAPQAEIDKQLDRLEGLVRQFQDSLNRFDQDLAVLTSSSCSSSSSSSNSRDVPDEPIHSSSRDEEKLDVSPSSPSSAAGATGAADDLHKIGRRKSKGRIVARYRPAWPEYFQFLSAVRLDAPLSCVHILPHEGEDGLSKYVAVGDQAGRIYIFSLHGDLLVDQEHASASKSPVTVMLSLVLRRNETLLVTGHSNGDVVAHLVWETPHEGASSMEDSLSLEYSHSYVNSGQQQQQQQQQEASVTNLEMYRVGRLRYLLVADASGKLQVFKENGTLYGTATSPSRPLAFLRTSNTQRLLFLTSRGASSLDLRSMTVKSSPCEGLDSSLVAFAFDAGGRSKAYGVTERGELVFVALSGDTLHFGCHAKAKRKLELNGPISLHGLKGYILIATPRQVAVYNTSLQLMNKHSSSYLRAAGGSSRSLFTSSMDEISLSFVDTPPSSSNKQPLLACDRDRVVVVGFGDGYVGVFRSNLPVHAVVNGWESKVPGGTSACFSIILLALAWYHFFGKKRDHQPRDGTEQHQLAAASAAAAAPPPPGTAAATTSGFGSPSAGRPNATFDKVRGAATAESRENILEESSRRYGSPSRALVGTTGTSAAAAAAAAAGGAAGAGGAAYGVLKYRNTAVDHYGTNSIRSTSSQ